MAVFKTIRGADLQVYINGELFAVCTGLRWNTSTGRRAINGIDKMSPFELAPGQTAVKGSIDCLRLRQDGGLEGRGIAAPDLPRGTSGGSYLLYEKYFALAVVDRSTDTIILAIDNCAVGDQNWNVNAKGMLTGNFSFVGIEWANEATK